MKLTNACAGSVRGLAAWALAASLLGCKQPARLGSEAPLSPRAVGTLARFEPIPLDVMPLDTHADYDAWEKLVLARGGPQLAYSMYEGALTKRRGSPRTFVRWVVLAHREALPDDFREALRSFVDALAQRADAEKNADILYLFGYLAWVRLIGGPTNPDVPVVEGNMALVDTVETNWNKLVALDPSWVGPNGVTVAVVQRRLRALAPTPRPPVAVGAAPEPVASLADFHSGWATLGPKRACDQLDGALASLQTSGAADNALLGDAYAFCAFERKNPAGALAHVTKMAVGRVDGAYDAILRRAARAAELDPALAAPLAAARQAVAAAVTADLAFATRNGLTLPPKVD